MPWPPIRSVAGRAAARARHGSVPIRCRSTRGRGPAVPAHHGFAAIVLPVACCNSSRRRLICHPPVLISTGHLSAARRGHHRRHSRSSRRSCLLLIVRPRLYPSAAIRSPPSIALDRPFLVHLPLSYIVIFPSMLVSCSTIVYPSPHTLLQFVKAVGVHIFMLLDQPVSSFLLRLVESRRFSINSPHIFLLRLCIISFC